MYLRLTGLFSYRKRREG